MANALYPKWKEAIMQFTANNNLSAGTVKVALIDTGVYTYSSTDQFYSSASSATVGTPQTIGSKTFTNGVFGGHQPAGCLHRHVRYRPARDPQRRQHHDHVERAGK